MLTTLPQPAPLEPEPVGAISQGESEAGSQHDQSPQSGQGAPKHPRYQRISMAARTKVLALHAEGVKNAEIARIIGISTQRVSEITNSLGDLKAQVQQVLNTHRVKAAEAWGRAIPKAAAKGDHRPARELLIATGDVSPLDSASSGVTVVVNMPGAEPQNGAKVAGSGSTLDNPFVMPSPQVLDK